MKVIFITLLLIFSIYGDDHGDTINTATSVNNNSITISEIEEAGDYDYFRITIPSSGTLTVNSTGSTDMYGYLLNSNGTQLAYNDDGGASYNFRISRSVTAGTYYVKVRHYSSSRIGNYSFVTNFSANIENSVEEEMTNSDDHGDTINTATSVNNNSITISEIEEAGDYDYFRITIPSSGTLTVNSTGSTDMYGYLLNSNGTQLAYNDDGGASYNFRISRSVTAGTYYVKVRHYSSSRIGNYSFVTNFSANIENSVEEEMTNSDDHGDTINTATSVNNNSITISEIEEAGDYDYFRITIPSSGTLTVNSTGSTDMYGYLLNSNGTQLAYNDDGGASYNFRISRSVTAGTYYVKVRHYSSSRIGNYSFVTNFSATPNIQKIVLLLHGLSSSADTWREVDNRLFNGECQLISVNSIYTQMDITNNIKCYKMNFGNYDVSGGLTGLEEITGSHRSCSSSNGCSGDYSTFNTLGREIKEVINKLLNIYNNNIDIILLGHSRGGLAARAFLQEAQSNMQKASVKGLITTGTPHRGSPFGRFYDYMQSFCSSPRTDHDNSNFYSNADCEDDWEIVDAWRLRGNLDLYSPSIGFLSPESSEIIDLNNNIFNLPSIQYKQMVYSGVDLGYLHPFYQILVNGGSNEPTDAAKEAILLGDTLSSYRGDGIVPTANQRFGKSEFSPEANDVLHAEETKEVNDISSVLIEMYNLLDWN